MVVHLFLNNNKDLDFLPINSIKNGGVTIPSWDEIKHRRELAEHYNMEIQSCNVNGESKPCVRIMRNQCNYGGGDLCVIDPK